MSARVKKKQFKTKREVRKDKTDRKLTQKKKKFAKKIAEALKQKPIKIFSQLFFFAKKVDDVTDGCLARNNKSENFL